MTKEQANTRAHDDAVSFHSARDAYRKARLLQRTVIVDALKSAGFFVQNRGRAGQGLETYTSGRRLDPAFDLSDWLWVAGERDGVMVTVTLQVLDQDPNSKNVHALVDRIGVVAARSGKTPHATDWLREDATTGLELPLDMQDRAALLELIELRVAELTAH